MLSLHGAPLTCNRNALTPAARTAHAALTRKLLSSITRRRLVRNGYEFELRNATISAADVGRWIEAERGCCPFLNFRLEITSGDNAKASLRLTGPAGTRAFLDSGLNSK